MPKTNPQIMILGPETRKIDSDKEQCTEGQS